MPVKKEKREQTPEEKALKEQMDAAGVVAAEALAKLDKKSVKVVGTWMQENFAKAGYKRLAKALLAAVKS